jgi:hypothetical protein
LLSGDDYFMAMAKVPIGGEFPVRLSDIGELHQSGAVLVQRELEF